MQASEGLDTAARQLLVAASRGGLLRLPGTTFGKELDDLPLAANLWASSSLQCFRYGEHSAGCEAHVDKGEGMRRRQGRDAGSVALQVLHWRGTTPAGTEAAMRCPCARRPADAHLGAGPARP